MPRWKCPEHIRTKAMRSRCCGSILACTLKTKPETAFSSGSIGRGSAGCGRGGGARSATPRSNSRTPKLLRALPKNTGVRCPSRYAVRSKGGQRPCAISTCSRRVAIAAAGRRCAMTGSSSPRHADRLDHLVPQTVLEQQQRIAQQIVGAEKIAPHADRPTRRRRIQRQGLLNFVDQVERVAAFAVELVDKGDDRHVAQPADLEQLAGLLLDAAGRVDDHDRAVHRGQRAIGVLAEILVARRVEQVEDDAVMLEGHHRRTDRDAALALDRHPVGTGPPPLAARLDLAGKLDRAAKQQQLFGQRGLAGIGVRDDREGAPARDLVGQRGHGACSDESGTIGRH